MTEKNIKKLLCNHKTPVYVFDTCELKQRINFLKNNLPESVSMCYAIKANTFIAEEVCKAVDYLEICSPGEYQICKTAGLPHSKFVVSGVNKTEDFIRTVVFEKEPVGCITVESVQQFEFIKKAAEAAGKKTKILLRLSSGNQFGLDKDEIIKLIANNKDNEQLDFEGIQFFSGTQKFSLKKIKRELNYLDDFIEELYSRFSVIPKKLEYGPGFPVAYFDGENFDEEEYLKEFSLVLGDMRFKGPVVLELGRSIAASCGTYLTTVEDVKQTNGELYAIVDGGIHQLVYYGQSMAMKQPKIRLISDFKDGELKYWNICGSLCTINDILVKRFPAYELHIGDVLAFEKAGAYCVTEGISLFLSRDLPSVVQMNENGEFIKIREQINTGEFNTRNKT